VRLYLSPYNISTAHSHVSRLAAEYGLHPFYKKEFHEVFEEFQEHSEFKPLLQRMNVIDANGETEMDEDQWEAASTLSPALYVLC
jgi:mRNA (guanine-N7-)-methyltransferase